MAMFKRMKVYDCQNMPGDIRDAFWKSTEGYGNDCYISWPWHNEAVNAWLKENGAKDGESVLINHWW